MKIYTSYFGFSKSIPSEITPVSIAKFSPKWFNGREIKILAPSKKLLWQTKQGKITEEEYARQYMAQIREVFNPQGLLEKLETEFSGKDIVLLCFEKKGEFCHRRLLAQWIEGESGLTIKEL